MYSTMLVPLDGSKEAEAILTYVENAARRYGAKVFLLKIEKEPLLLEWDEVVDVAYCQAEFERRSEQAFSYLSIQREELRKKGIDPHRPPDPSTGSTDEKEESSLDLSLDLYDLFCRYRCKICDFEWEEKPPPIYRHDAPPPSHENGG